MESNTWAIGDSLVVKPGVTDPVTGIALSGWQGRLIALEDEGDRLSIQWDSLTLKSMPPAYIVECEEWGVPWSAMRQYMLEARSEEHTSELQSHLNLVCRLLLEKKKKNK